MKNMSIFQVLFVGLFVFFMLLGVAAFALFGGAFNSGSAGKVVIWGTDPQERIDGLLTTLRTDNKTLTDVVYIQKDSDTYEGELINAMAAGTAPDLVMLSQEQLGVFADKIITIPYGVVSQSIFVNSYIDEGQLFLTPQGSLAIPFSVDPLVMYWNRDLFGGVGLAQPPKFWSEFHDLAPKLYSASAGQQITRSAVAMGAWQNVRHAKAVLSTLFMQTGEFITARNESGQFVTTFGTNAAQNSGGESALRFYTEFANPSKVSYSWNRSMPPSDEAFLAGRLAVYFGFASEYQDIGARNPNLRFGVAAMPQLQSGNTRLTYGKILGFAIPRGAANVNGAAMVAQTLTSLQAAQVLLGLGGALPARRDVQVDTSVSAVAQTFVESAFVSRGWYDPNPRATDQIFRDMVDSVVSGRTEPAGAIGAAGQELRELLGF